MSWRAECHSGSCWSWARLMSFLGRFWRSCWRRAWVIMNKFSSSVITIEFEIFFLDWIFFRWNFLIIFLICF